ncbi:uncharacterized protein [Hetaerina americana]|uniref:uncharacterized protein n=1 Tax=Hetaerina americana TaxID=62018 RepID=UPI003A7F57FE
MKDKRRSLLWSYFSIIDSSMATCNICKQQLSHKSSSSNLRKHLLRKHPCVDPQSIEPGRMSSVSKKSETTSPKESLGNDESLEVPHDSSTSIINSTSKNVSSSEGKDDPPNDDAMESSSMEFELVHIPSTNLNGSLNKNTVNPERSIEFPKQIDESSDRAKAVEINEYEAIGVSVAAKLQRMDPIQAVYAESLIIQVLCKGLLKSLTSTNLSELNE